jgi:hypothetical protein
MEPSDGINSTESTHRRQRVAMLVFNPCAPDHRVTKEAEHLAGAGRQVRIYCLRKEGLPDVETINGVEYRRFGIDWRKTLVRALLRWSRLRR